MPASPSASAPGPASATGGARAPTLAFLVTEDWFFCSHFLPMARAAREMGLEVAVITRVRDHRATIEATGARVIPLEAERRSLNPVAVAANVARLAAILREVRPDILHMIALRSILVGGVAARLAGVSRRVYALTGLGFLGARRDALGRGAASLIRALVRGPLENAATCYLLENPDDAADLGLTADDPRVVIVGGAGVDPDVFTPAPQPEEPTLRVAVVARMLWSKGVDLAVEAVLRARARGADVTLSLYGAPDPSNPRAIPEATLRAWGETPGISWRGRTSDIPGVWRDHHVALLPSRGGEGLPRTLLEAAACGRAIVTTDVPGCRLFVRDGVDGFVVPPDDAAALAERLQRLAADRALTLACGANARERLLSGFTERHVMDRVKAMYAALLARNGGDRR
ncbi:glycosyltransferase family 4 protein [Camelimonas abortus]|uniref:Glycosyltransferase family 4 protein n=1 Tax=Camelimonas abortus TaxID=1017184 RepID=A0ABV7LCP4_9HYPH